MEKRNFINKNIRKLNNNDGSTIVDQNLILNQVKIYHKNLYSSRDNTLNDCNLSYIIEETTPTLTDQESLTLEGNITCEDILTALKLMKNGKSPGTDGFSVEFYKMFWSDLKQYILRSYNHAF